MASRGLPCAPEQVANLKGDEARGQFINLFKEVQRLKTQLDQYTDLTPENLARHRAGHSRKTNCGLSVVSIWRPPSASKFSKLRAVTNRAEVQQLDFEFVLFASAVIDYDYIMALIARYTQGKPGKQKMTREELIGLIQSDAKFMDEREDIAAYIDTLKPGQGLSEDQIRQGYENFKSEKLSPLTGGSGREARAGNVGTAGLC